jgi:hypothetical protein
MPKITGSAAQIAGDYFVKSFDQIAAVGVTDAIQINGLANHTFQVTTADIDTNVIIRLEGSLDNSNWGNIAADGADETITTDGTTLFSRSNLPLEYVRVRFVSESGTTTPTVDVAYAGTR